MKIKKVIEELRTAILPYLFFWDEWIADENCNLNADEISTINYHLKNNFEISLLEQLWLYDQIVFIQKIIRKLNLGYQVFKDLVIVNFLCSIIAIAKEHDYENFLRAPIDQLPVHADLRACLKAFNTYTLEQLFIIYKPEDFGRGWVYKRIVEFQMIKKRHSIINQSTSHQMKTNSS